MTSNDPSSAAAARVRVRPWIGFAIFYVIVTLLYAHPLLRVLGSALPHDTGDPALNAWILWWDAQALPLTSAWWNAPIFHPVAGSIAFSETLLNLWPIAAPLQWMGISAVATANLMFLLSFPSAALGAHALAHRLTGSHAAAMVAGVAFAFSPYRAAQIAHVQLLWTCWMPLALLALHRYVNTRATRHLVLFGLCWLMNGLASGYFFVYFGVLTASWVAWFIRRPRDVAAIALAIVVATAALAPLLLGYRQVQSALGMSRSASEIESFSADVDALWAATDEIVARRWTHESRPEGQLYPGMAIVGFGIVGVIAVTLGRERSRRSVAWFYCGAAVAMLVFAFGPVVRFHGAVLFSHAPYWWLMQLPGGDALRVPARFAMLSTLCLSLAAAIGVNSLARHRAALAVAAAAVVMILAEGWMPSMPVIPIERAIALAGVDRNTTVLELPMAGVYADTAAMLLATQQPHRLINGFSGYAPPHYALLREGTQVFDPSTLEALQRTGPFVVFVRPGDDHVRYREYVERIPGSFLLWSNSSGSLYRLPAVPRSPLVDRSSEIASASMNGDAAEGAAMLDHQLSTRGHTPDNQRAGDELVIRLRRPMAVRGIAMDLGEFRGDYPRRIRVTSADASTTLWEGSTLGWAALGLIDDVRRAPVMIELPDSPPTAEIRVTVTTGDDFSWWSVAELRVFVAGVAQR